MFSNIINVAIKEYIERNNPSFYGKIETETILYRNIVLRITNIKKSNEYSRKAGTSFTRLVNGAIKEFLNNK